MKKQSINLRSLLQVAVLLLAVYNCGAQIKPMPAKALTDKDVIYYPTPANIQYLNTARNHSAYNPSTHSFDKNYLLRKYMLRFELPPFKSIGYTVPSKVGPDGKLSKPKFKCEFFTPRLVLKNLINNSVKEIDLSNVNLHNPAYYPVTATVDGYGDYEFRMEQTFPAEAAFRDLVKHLFVPDGDPEQDEFNRLREEEIQRRVNEYKALLGKKTSTAIYKFSAFNDLLVASIGDSYSSGEGNPMECGKDLPKDGDEITEVISDVTGAVKTYVSEIKDGDYKALLGPAYVAAITMGSIAEQIIGPCTITTANLAGLMNPNFDVPVNWIEGAEKAHRSYINPVAPATFSIPLKYQGMAVTYLSFATSGATGENLYKTNQKNFQKVCQIDELANNLKNTNREIDALTISIGANDIGFSKNLSELLGGEALKILNNFDYPFLSAVLARIQGINRDRIRGIMLTEVNNMENKFKLISDAIKSKLKVHKVFVLEYPNAQFTVKDNQGNIVTRPGCGVLKLGPVNVDQADAELITEMGNALNNKLKELAEKAGWVFVAGSTDIFKGHGYCANSADSYYRAAETSCGCQGDYMGMLHPNRKGFAGVKPIMLKAMENAFPFDILRKGISTTPPNTN